MAALAPTVSLAQLSAASSSALASGLRPATAALSTSASEAATLAARAAPVSSTRRVETYCVKSWGGRG